MELDTEQTTVLDYILNKGSCYVVGPPGTGKTEIFNALGESINCSAAFLPFTRAARKELVDRLPHLEVETREQTVKLPIHNVVVATINSFCQSYLSGFNGYDEQLNDFLKLKVKPSFSLVGIDEVQDLSPFHFDVIQSIINGRLFAGGDPNQTIFTFSDAIGYRVFKSLEDLGCKKFELHNDYRSSPKVVSILNYLVPNGIKGLGPKTYNRNALFTRTHNQLRSVSRYLRTKNIPHTIRSQNAKDTVVLGENNLFLMVTHACKGLGFDRVIQLDWHLPHSPYTNYQEEFNLMYVSVARASKEFYIVDGNENTNCWPHLKNTETNTIASSQLLELLSKLD